MPAEVGPNSLGQFPDLDNNVAPYNLKNFSCESNLCHTAQTIIV